ncbi:MAG: hypothetical protein CMJ27_11805 [Phycisphaerae bacterium]|nr:hypothetical protein [Phycisphaerae bacterium]OUX00401.1 MAG: hypothetical protein CBD91_06880 [Phycisphaeraceae bacterium TMED231]
MDSPFRLRPSFLPARPAGSVERARIGHESGSSNTVKSKGVFASRQPIDDSPGEEATQKQPPRRR